MMVKNMQNDSVPEGLRRALLEQQLTFLRGRIAEHQRAAETACAKSRECLLRSLEIRRELLALDRASEPETFPDTKPEIPLAKCDSTR